MASSIESNHVCNICSEKFEKLSLYVAHTESFDHKIKEALMETEMVAAKNPNIGANYDAVEVYRCQVCNIFVTGLIPYKQHIDGIKHQKKLRNREVIQKAMTSLTGQLGGLKLEITDEKCRGSSPTKSDLINDSEEEEETKSAQRLNSSLVSTMMPIPFPFSCQPCGKKFSGAEPYSQHLESAMHFRKCNLAKGNEPVLGSYMCKICNVNFSGPVPFQQHMESPKHAKQVEMNRRWASVTVDNVGDGETTSLAILTAEYEARQKKELQAWDELARAKAYLSKPELPDDISYIGVDEPVDLK